MNDYNKITALYSRLSVGDEDRDGGESNSIQNHRQMRKHKRESGEKPERSRHCMRERLSKMSLGNREG